MVAQVFHWAVAALVLVQIVLGIYAAQLPLGLERLRWLSRHKALGVSVLALVTLRLLWRRMRPPPALPSSLPRWERGAASAVHRLLYALLLLAPLTGWAYAGAAGLSVSWFGVFALPDLVGRNRALATLLGPAHVASVSVLAVLVAMHVAAALRHALRGDGVVQRMLPAPRRERRR